MEKKKKRDLPIALCIVISTEKTKTIWARYMTVSFCIHAVISDSLIFQSHERLFILHDCTVPLVRVPSFKPNLTIIFFLCWAALSNFRSKLVGIFSPVNHKDFQGWKTYVSRFFCLQTCRKSTFCFFFSFFFSAS